MASRNPEIRPVQSRSDSDLRRRMRRRGAVGLVTLQLCMAVPALPPAAMSQVDARTLPGPLADLASALSVILIPKIFADVTSLRDYIRSEEFALLRAERGDLRAVDAIFEEASRLCWGNRGEALYVTAMATMDHRRVGVRVPELGPFLWLPLTSEFEGDFADRVARLPSALYPDSPPGTAGDRDKLQHFFGSAFLTFVSGSERDGRGSGQVRRVGRGGVHRGRACRQPRSSRRPPWPGFRAAPAVRSLRTAVGVAPFCHRPPAADDARAPRPSRVSHSAR